MLFGSMPALVSAGTQASEALKDGTRTSTGVRGRRLSRGWSLPKWRSRAQCWWRRRCSCAASNRMMQRTDRGCGAGNVVTRRCSWGARPTRTGSRSSSSTQRCWMESGVSPGSKLPGSQRRGARNRMAGPVPRRGASGATGRRSADRAARHRRRGYFETFRVRLIEGRFFTPADTAAAEGVVVVNETFARRVFPVRMPSGSGSSRRRSRSGPRDET